jgi:hypothetical protein
MVSWLNYKYARSHERCLAAVASGNIILSALLWLTVATIRRYFVVKPFGTSLKKEVKN